MFLFLVLRNLLYQVRVFELLSEIEIAHCFYYLAAQFKGSEKIQVDKVATLLIKFFLNVKSEAVFGIEAVDSDSKIK